MWLGHFFSIALYTECKGQSIENLNHELGPWLWVENWHTKNVAKIIREDYKKKIMLFP